VKLISAILAAGVAALIAAAPAAASAATASAATASHGTTAAHAVTAARATRAPQRHCVIVVGGLSQGQATSQVVDECSSTHAPGSTLPAGADTRKLTLLVQFYEGVNFTGPHVALYGSAGPCTAAKYIFPDLRTVNGEVGGISSYRLFNNCRFASYWRNIDFRGPKKGPVPGSNRYVGGLWAGHLWSMKIWA
jgi:hypothetical protein